MGFWKSINFVSLFVFFAVLLGIMLNVDDSLACKYSYLSYIQLKTQLIKHICFIVKCYDCLSQKKATRCDPENRGELKTCVHKVHTLCYKFVTTKPYTEDQIKGESRRKGCGSFLRDNHTMGCQFWTEWTDICYCDTDRCNAHEHPQAPEN